MTVQLMLMILRVCLLSVFTDPCLVADFRCPRNQAKSRIISQRDTQETVWISAGAPSQVYKLPCIHSEARDTGPFQPLYKETDRMIIRA
jgi:hypothetical protein